MKIFLTGSSGVGKSTALLTIIEALVAKGLRIGGIITPEVRAKGRRIAFKVVDLASDKEGVLASIDRRTGPRVGKYWVDLQDFERIALPALSFALENCEVICLDELGIMEFFSTKFSQKVDKILCSEKPVIAIIHRNYVKSYENKGNLLQITPENREEIVHTVVSQILRTRPSR
jgi:nucleoside-triphosphatase